MAHDGWSLAWRSACRHGPKRLRTRSAGYDDARDRPTDHADRRPLDRTGDRVTRADPDIDGDADAGRADPG